MSEFIITPTNVDFLESIFRNPITGRWTIPILTFNTNYPNPFYTDIDPLNDDPQYHKKVIDHFYTRLTEKWLYREPIYRKLLRYFRVEKNGEEGKVMLVSDPEQVSKSNVNDEYKNHVFKYIEKYFITKHFVSKILKKYVKTTHIKWYDLFYNTDTLKHLFAHKLKRLIVSTIYQLQNKNDDDITKNKDKINIVPANSRERRRSKFFD